MLIDLDRITCNHLRLRAALMRIIRAHTWAIAPYALALFALMAWWGQSNPQLWQPLCLLGALICIGVCQLCSWAAVLWAGAEARDLRGFHDLVLQTSQEDEEDLESAHA